MKSKGETILVLLLLFLVFIEWVNLTVCKYILQKTLKTRKILKKKVL